MKGAFFPLGDTPCDEEERELCLWRELSFALHLVRQAVNPSLKINECLNNWQEIAKELAEPPRKRRQQMRQLAMEY
jgi:hypothetical protein